MCAGSTGRPSATVELPEHPGDPLTPNRGIWLISVPAPHEPQAPHPFVGIAASYDDAPQLRYSSHGCSSVGVCTPLPAQRSRAGRPIARPVLWRESWPPFTSMNRRADPLNNTSWPKTVRPRTFIHLLLEQCEAIRAQQEFRESRIQAVLETRALLVQLAASELRDPRGRALAQRAKQLLLNYPSALDFPFVDPVPCMVESDRQ
jgi:hypothetical protein